MPYSMKMPASWTAARASLPRRLMVLDEDFEKAERLLREAAPSFSVTDTFLDGRVKARQPDSGFRSGTDAVMLAAAVPAQAGESALELGAGSGAASLCLAARVPGVVVTGVEIDGALVSLARDNAAANGLQARFERRRLHSACRPSSSGTMARSLPIRPSMARAPYRPIWRGRAP